jgi:multiple antibiotic resistance protein
MFNWFHIVLTTIIALFPIVDPMGAIPLFITFTEGDSEKKRANQLFKACLYVFSMLTVFLVAGNLLISFFNISLPGIRIAGGLVLAKIALDLLRAEPHFRPTEEERAESIEKRDISFIPLAMPTLSGPGAIAVTLGLTPMLEHWYDYLAIILGILLITISCWLILKASTRILKYIGINGMHVISQLMGFMLLCVGIQFMINGVVGVVKEYHLLGQ